MSVLFLITLPILAQISNGTNVDRSRELNFPFVSFFPPTFIDLDFCLCASLRDLKFFMTPLVRCVIIIWRISFVICISDGILTFSLCVSI